MTDRTLPHDPYITAVCEALTAAGLTPADHFTDDCDTSGSHRYLRAVITLDPDTTGLDADRWPHGLVLIWEWHTGIEASEPERGPSWAVAVLADSHGECGERLPFTALGYPSPGYITESVRALAGRRNQSTPAERYEQADALDAACDAWGATETGA